MMAIFLSLSPIASIPSPKSLSPSRCRKRLNENSMKMTMTAETRGLNGPTGSLSRYMTKPAARPRNAPTNTTSQKRLERCMTSSPSTSMGNMVNMEKAALRAPNAGLFLPPSLTGSGAVASPVYDLDSIADSIVPLMRAFPPSPTAQSRSST